MTMQREQTMLNTFMSKAKRKIQKAFQHQRSLGLAAG